MKESSRRSLTGSAEKGSWKQSRVNSGRKCVQGGKGLGSEQGSTGGGGVYHGGQVGEKGD